MSERYSRRDFLAGVLATGTLTAAATYLAPGGHPPPPVKLNLLTGEDRTGAHALLIDMWNRANPNTTVVPTVITGETIDQRNEMIAAARNGTADVLNLDTINIQYFADQGLITPMKLENVTVFLANTLAPSRVKGDPDRYWAAPFNTDVGMLFQRVSANQQAAPGTPGPSLAQVVDGLARDGSGQFTGQLAPSSSISQEAFVVNVLEHALSRDSEILDENGLPAYDLGRWQRAMEPLRVAIDRGRVTRSDTEDDTRDTFQRQSLRYMRNWPVKYRELQQNDDRDVKMARIRVTPLPLGILGGQSLALVKKSPHASRAIDLIRFLTDEPAQKIVAAYGLAPTRSAAYSDSTLSAFIPHLDAIRGAVESGYPRPIHPNYGTFSQVIVRHLRNLLDNHVDLPSEFIDEMRAALR